MGNSWFQFQKFKIEQGRSAMKVCTDSCLFAASIPCQNSRRILDVGAGTGLVGLMLAQRNPFAEIHFIEPDFGSFLDLKDNISSSPWANRCFAFNINLEKFSAAGLETFDLIAINPPFFINHLKSSNSRRNGSMHLNKENWDLWVCQLNELLSSEGELWILLPGGKVGKEMLDSFIKFNIFPHKILEISQKENHFRIFAGLNRKGEGEIEKAHLEMRNPEGNLARWASILMKNFYLEPPVDSTNP